MDKLRNTNLIVMLDSYLEYNILLFTTVNPHTVLVLWIENIFRWHAIICYPFVSTHHWNDHIWKRILWLKKKEFQVVQWLHDYNIARWSKIAAFLWFVTKICMISYRLVCTIYIKFKTRSVGTKENSFLWSLLTPIALERKFERFFRSDYSCHEIHSL